MVGNEERCWLVLGGGNDRSLKVVTSCLTTGYKWLTGYDRTGYNQLWPVWLQLVMAGSIRFQAVSGHNVTSYGYGYLNLGQKTGLNWTCKPYHQHHPTCGL